MFESGTHSIPRRIVSLAQPWVRPIVWGKPHANTKFGAKLHISLVDGYARIERLDFGAVRLCLLGFHRYFVDLAQLPCFFKQALDGVVNKQGAK